MEVGYRMNSKQAKTEMSLIMQQKTVSVSRLKEVLKILDSEQSKERLSIVRNAKEKGKKQQQYIERLEQRIKEQRREIRREFHDN